MRKMRELTSEERAYVAGIVDGEGYVGLVLKHKNRVRPSYFPQIQVSNVDENLMRYLEQLVPASFFLKIGSRAKNQKDCFIWAIQRTDGAKKFLELVLPYLIVKKQRAQVLLQYCQSRLLRGLRSSYIPEEIACYSQLRVLNRKGRNS